MWAVTEKNESTIEPAMLRHANRSSVASLDYGVIDVRAWGRPDVLLWFTLWTENCFNKAL